MKHLFFALPALFAIALLTGCPDTKLPDKPSTVPQPKASLNALHPYEI